MTLSDLDEYGSESDSPFLLDLGDTPLEESGLFDPIRPPAPPAPSFLDALMSGTKRKAEEEADECSHKRPPQPAESAQAPPPPAAVCAQVPPPAVVQVPAPVYAQAPYYLPPPPVVWQYGQPPQELFPGGCASPPPCGAPAGGRSP